MGSSAEELSPPFIRTMKSMLSNFRKWPIMDFSVPPSLEAAWVKTVFGVEFSNEMD
jgi:hypothetical protein